MRASSLNGKGEPNGATNTNKPDLAITHPRLDGASAHLVVFCDLLLPKERIDFRLLSMNHTFGSQQTILTQNRQAMPQSQLWGRTDMGKARLPRIRVKPAVTLDPRILEAADEYCRFSRRAVNQEFVVFQDSKAFGSALSRETTTELKLLLSKLAPFVCAAIDSGKSSPGNEDVVRGVMDLVQSIGRSGKDNPHLFRSLFRIFLSAAEALTTLAESDKAFAQANAAFYYRWPNLKPSIRRALGTRSSAIVHSDRGPHMVLLEAWVDKFIIERERYILFRERSNRDAVQPDGNRLVVLSPWGISDFTIGPFEPDSNARIKEWVNAVLGGIETHDAEFRSFNSLGEKKSIRRKNASKHIERILTSRFKMGIFEVDPARKTHPIRP